MLSWAVINCTATDGVDVSNLLSRAESGDAEAQCTLGYSYAYGQGVETNYNKSVELYQQGDALDEPWGQAKLGYYYYDVGLVVEED